MKKILIFLLLAPVIAMAAEGGATYPNHPFKGDMTNSASIQRGAKDFVNYCQGCHSLKYQRYSRLAEDTGLDVDIAQKNLIFTGARVSETMDSAIPVVESATWFGKQPPDLSLIARSKGADYIYNYLLGFYLDPTRATGVNNSVFPLVAMPNVLSVLEGDKTPTYHESKWCETVEGEEVCHETKAVNGFESVHPGHLSEDEFEKTVYDLSNFLYYVSDPSEIKRHQLGPWILSFLVLMTIVFYFLKREFWKDVH